MISIEVNLTASIRTSNIYCILHCLDPSTVALVPDWTNNFCPVTCGVAFPRELPVCGLPGPWQWWAIHQWSCILGLEFSNQTTREGMARDDNNGRLPIEQPFIFSMSCFCAKVAANAIADASLAWTKISDLSFLVTFSYFQVIHLGNVFRVFRILFKPPWFECLKPGCQARSSLMTIVKVIHLMTIIN